MTGKRRPVEMSTDSFATAHLQVERVGFRLYVAGTSARSLRAIQSLRSVCDSRPAGSYDLEVIDILQQPGRARVDQIIAVPTLIRHLPLPVKRFVGDVLTGSNLLAGLNLEAK
jgi:circadian clock protein KaiB